jgi:hypothetical protein
MSGARSRNKGANAERSVTNYLRKRGHQVRRFLAGDGEQPGDIDGIDGLCIEVKNAGIYDFPAWLRQVKEEARDGDLPIVVSKPKGITDVDEWFTVVKFGDFMTHWEETHGPFDGRSHTHLLHHREWQSSGSPEG